MERIVTVVGASGATADVRLGLVADASVGDVLPDLQRLVGAATGVVRRGARALDLRMPLRDLADGDVLAVGNDDRAEAATDGRGVILEVTGGPDAGRLLRLAPGRHPLGRGGVLDSSDPLVSRCHVELTVSPDGSVAVTDSGSTNGARLDGERLPAGASAAWPAGTELLLGSTRLTHGREVGAAALVPRPGGSLLVNPPPRLSTPPEPRTVRFPAPPAAPTPPRLPLLASIAPLAAGLVLAFVLRRWEFAAFALMSPLVVLGQAASDRWSARRSRIAAATAHDAAVAAAEEELRSALAAEASARRDAAPDPARVVRAATARTDLLWHRRPGDSDALRLRLGIGDVAPATVVEGAPAPGALRDVPVVVDLARTRTLGIRGDDAAATAISRALVAQLAALHGPSTLRLVVLAPGHARRWAWVRWLPHLRRDGSRAALATTAPQVRMRLDELAADPGDAPIVVVVDGVDDLSVAQTLAARDHVFVVWLATSDRPLPAACAAVVDVPRCGVATLRQSGAVDTLVTADLLAADVAEDLARALAPLRDVAAAEAGAIPSSVRWSDLYDLDLAEPEAAAQTLARRWRSGPSTTVRLGVGPDGPVALDLRADGPHMLVAGTTGSGKSELLQSLVASLVAANSPRQLTLLLVDFKGGAAFGLCRDLPHVVGVLTDLDAATTTRALTSLSAELRRRERLLAAAGVADLDALPQTADDAAAVPRLVIVVDEFATLAEELPDFVGGLVGIAQRGRSLGVHLVLATQRPEGAVSADIRANTRLRVCLAVARENESRDVLDSPKAATISRATPGRAFVRAGAHELREVQTARVAGPWSPRAPRVAVLPLPAWGDPALPPPASATVTELDLLVAAARTAAEITPRGHDRPAAPWLPPLPTTVGAADVPPASPGTVAIGVVDLPHEQRQPAYTLDVDGCDPLLVVGASRSGRTTAAVTVVTALAGALGPDDLHVYAIDSGRGLGALAALPHTGAVVDARDPERVERLLVHLSAEVEQRRDAAGQPQPQLLLVVDSWDGVVGATSDGDAGRCQDLLLRLVAAGAGSRLRVVVTSDRSGLAGRLGASIADKLCLRLADRGDYALLGIPTRQVPTHLPDGRGVRCGDLAWVQVAVADESTLAAARRWPLPARPPRRFDPLPPRVPLHEVAHPSGVVVGVRSDDLAPLVLDPRDSGVLLVAGPPGSGRSTTLVTLASQLRDRPVVALCPRRGPMRQRRDLATVVDPADPDELERAFSAVGDGAALLVDDVDLLDDPRALDGIDAAVRRARDGDGFVVLAGATDAMAASFRGPVATARRSRSGLLLRPEGPHDGELLGVRLRRRAVHGDPPGRGLLALNGTAVAVQVPDPD